MAREISKLVLVLLLGASNSCSNPGRPPSTRGISDIPPLVQAIRSNDHADLRRLLDHGVSPNLASGDKWDYPLIEACVIGKKRLVFALVEAGANVNVQSQRGTFGITPVGVALNSRQPSIVEFLISTGADPEGLTPLMLAVLSRDESRVRKLIGNDQSVNMRNRFGRSAIDYARPDRHLVSLLLEAGAQHSYSPPEISAILDNPAKLSEQLDVIDVRNQEPLAKSALHLAIEFDSRSVVKLLLERNTDLGVDDAGQLTALCVAARHGRTELIRLLLAAGADPKAKCNGVFYPSQIARSFGHLKCATIIERAANP